MVSGTVRTDDGSPVSGVLVMGADLNYAETGDDGSFRLARPEMALFFWCTGFLPEARVLTRPASGDDVRVDVVLRRVMVMRAGV
jgi:hypothetical protein